MNESAFAGCIPVNGLQFEKISDTELIASKNGKNLAAIQVSTEDRIQWGQLPGKIDMFRFFSENLCDFGAEKRVHINGSLYYVQTIVLFQQ